MSKKKKRGKKGRFVKGVKETVGEEPRGSEFPSFLNPGLWGGFRWY